MDPNANLREQLRLAAKDWTANPERSVDGAPVTAAQFDRLLAEHIRLCDLVESLDEWIRRGGFLPDTWQNALNKWQSEVTK